MSHAVECNCFGCKVKTISVAAALTPNRSRSHGVKSVDKTNSNAWERGIAKDERGVPILMPGMLEPMPIKHYVEHRRAVDSGIRQNRTPSIPEEG